MSITPSGAVGAGDRDRIARDAQPAFGEQPHRQRIEPVLGREDARRQARLVIVAVHRHDRLRDDRPGIDLVAHEMHGAAGKPDAGGERLPLRMKSGEGRQQRGMDIDEPIAPSRDKRAVEDAHISGQRDESDAALPQRGIGRRGEGLPALLGNNAVRDPGAGGPPEARRLGAVADHENDFGRIGRVGGGLDQRLQVRPAARDQNADLEPGHCPPIGSSALGRHAASAMHRITASHHGVASQTALSPAKRGRCAARIRDRGRSAMTLPLMAASAGGRSGRRIAGAAFLSLLLLVQAAGEPARAQETDPFSATVKVDARADTAAKAREAARIDGQRRALAAIAERLSGGGAPAKAAEARRQGDHRSRRQFRGCERAHVGGALSGRLHVSFPAGRDPAGPGCCRDAGAGTAEAPRQPPAAKPDVAEQSATSTVIIPVYQSAGRAVLWEDPNPWREAWDHAPATSGPVVVPLGDAGDLAAIDAGKARAGDSDAIAAVARRNGGEEALVAVAVLQGSSDRPTGLDVGLHRYRGGRLVDTRSKGFTANPGESTAELLRRAVAAVAPDIGAGQEPEPPPWLFRGSRSKRKRSRRCCR